MSELGLLVNSRYCRWMHQNRYDNSSSPQGQCLRCSGKSISLKNLFASHIEKWWNGGHLIMLLNKPSKAVSRFIISRMLGCLRLTQGNVLMCKHIGALALYFYWWIMSTNQRQFNNKKDQQSSTHLLIKKSREPHKLIHKVKIPLSYRLWLHVAQSLFLHSPTTVTKITFFNQSAS